MRKFLILAFIIFSLAGYFTVSRVASCQAQTCVACGQICIGMVPPPGSLISALATIDDFVVFRDIDQAQMTLEAYFQSLTQEFWAGIQPVMQWSTQNITDWINTFWNYSLEPEMRAMTRQLSDATLEQTFELGMFADAVNMIHTERALDDLAIQDHRAERPSGKVCTAGTLMSGMERANVFSDSYQAYGAEDKWWIAANTYGSSGQHGFAEYLNERWQNNGGKVQAIVTGQGPGAAGFLAGGHVPIWCNHLYNKGYAGCAQDGVLAGQDVDIGRIFAQDTIPLDPAQDSNKYNKGDLDEMVTNLAESFGKDPVGAGLAGKDGILNALSYRTRRQIVYDSLFYVISRRVPGGFRSDSKSNPAPQNPEEFVNLLKEVRGPTGEGDSTGCGLSGAPCATPDPSRNEIFRAMIAQRFQSGQYALGQIDEPENNAREQVVDEALQLIQMNDQLELMDHYSLLLASEISNEIVQKTSLTPASTGAPMP